MLSSTRKPLEPRPPPQPFLRRVITLPELVDPTRHPFNIRAFRGGIDVELRKCVTFFVGENGSGKSTLLEAIAKKCKFHPEGGSRDHQRRAREAYEEDLPGDDESGLASALRLSWLPKVTDGFFLRAESFYNFATYVDEVSTFQRYGGKSLLKQSHGESFLSLFVHHFELGVFILDEPEAALSPQRQLSFLKVIHDLEASRQAQFLISTHSPILLAYPGATLLSLDGDRIEEVAYAETDHYRVTRDFLNCPERYFKHLFAGEESESGEV